MMKRFEGKNLDEALEGAAGSLGVSRHELKYSVVSEKRGFLGGVKRVVIEAEAEQKKAPEPVATAAKAKRTENGDSGRSAGGRSGSARKPANRRSRSKTSPAGRPAVEDDDDDGWVIIGANGDDSEPEEKVEIEANPRESKPRESRPRESKPRESEQRDRGESQGDDDKKGRSRRRGRGGRGRKKPETAEPPAREAVAVDVPEQGEQSDEAKAVGEWCTRVLELSQLDLVARTVDTDDEIQVEIFGSDVTLAQKNGGELLDSIQVLANKAQPGRQSERRVELDAGGFKKERTEKIAQEAAEVAAAVREEGREQAMGSMTPIERRIVHMTVREIEGVTTESRGRGFHKRVVILPGDDEDQSQLASGE